MSSNHEKAIEYLKSAQKETDPDLKQIKIKAAKRYMGIDISQAELDIKKNRPGYRFIPIFLWATILLAMLTLIFVLLAHRFSVPLVVAVVTPIVEVFTALSLVALLAAGILSPAQFVQSLPFLMKIFGDRKIIDQPTSTLPSLHAGEDHHPQNLPAPKVDVEDIDS